MDIIWRYWPRMKTDIFHKEAFAEDMIYDFFLDCLDTRNKWNVDGDLCLQQQEAKIGWHHFEGNLAEIM